LKKLGRLKSLKREWQAYEKSREKLTAMRARINELRDADTLRFPVIQELQNAVSKLKLAVSLNVDVSSLASTTTVAPDARQLSRVIGSGGKNVNSLESTHNVKIEVERRDLTIVVTGGADEVAAATKAIEAITTSVEESFPITNKSVIDYLAGNRATRLRKLESELGVRLDRMSSTNSVQISGPPEGVNSAKSHLTALSGSISSHCLSLNSRQLSVVLGKGGGE